MELQCALELGRAARLGLPDACVSLKLNLDPLTCPTTRPSWALHPLSLATWLVPLTLPPSWVSRQDRRRLSPAPLQVPDTLTAFGESAASPLGPTTLPADPHPHAASTRAAATPKKRRPRADRLRRSLPTSLVAIARIAASFHRGGRCARRADASVLV